MGKIKYLTDIMKLFEKSSVVNFDSIERIIKSKRGSSSYAKQIVYYLIKNGKIKKLAKGVYTNRNDVNLSVFCFEPAYLGLQDALSFHNIWEQETVPIIITTKKVRKGIRKILGQNVLIRSIDKRYFFGFKHFQEKDIALPYSDIEKTLIDMIYFKENIDKNVLDNFIEKINKKKLISYLRKYPIKFRKSVIKKTMHHHALKTSIRKN